MDITVYVNSKKADPLITAATEEYSKRLRPFCNLRTVYATATAKPAAGNNVHNFCIMTASKSGIHTISSEKFASDILKLTVNGISKINFYIGYPFSSDTACIPFAITSVTLDPSMCTIALCEQIYRAYTIQNHLPYHK